MKKLILIVMLGFMLAASTWAQFYPSADTGEGEASYTFVDHYDFRGGLNTSMAPHQIQDNQASYCVNAVLDSDSVLTKRPGYTHFNTSALGSDRQPIWGLHRFYMRDGTRRTLAACDGKLWVWSDASNSFDELKSGLTTSREHQWHFVTYMDRVFCCNGEDPVQVYDYDTNKSPSDLIYACGLAAPGSACSGAEVNPGAGSISDGSYLYKTTFYDNDTGTESNASDPSSTVSVSSGPSDILVSSIPTPLAAVNTARGTSLYRKVYRTEHDGGTYYPVTTIENSTWTSFTDTTPDSELTGSPPPITNDIPPTFTDLCVHKGQLLGAGDPDNPGRVYFSSLIGSEGPEAWDPLTNVELDDGTGGIVRRVITMGEDVFVFADTALYSFIGGAWSAAYLPTIRKVRSTNGTVAAGSVVNCNGVLLYLSRIGEHLAVVLFDGQIPTTLSDNIVDEFDDIIEGQLQYATASYSDRRYRLAVQKSGSYDCNNWVYEYNVPNKSWWPLSGLYVNCWSLWDGSQDEGELMFGAGHDGYICAYGDVGKDYLHTGPVEIPFTYRTKYYTDGHPQLFKQLRYVYLDFSKGPEDELGFKMIMDYDRDEIEMDIDLSAYVQSQWGSCQWGHFQWGQRGPLQHKIVVMPKKAKSRYYALEFKDPV